MKFGYARISKDDQNLVLQIDALNKYGVDEIYKEGATGIRPNTQHLTELLEKLREGDTLVIWRLDRLGRTIKQLLALVENFKKRGIAFVSLTEKIDTAIPLGKTAFVMLCSLAQMERNVIAERTKSGLAAAKKRGGISGRKPKDDENVGRALKMYFSNEFSIKDIVEDTGLSKTTIYKYVRDHK